MGRDILSSVNAYLEDWKGIARQVLSRPWLVAALFLAVGFVVYSNSLGSDFMLDDYAFFNPTKTNIRFLWYHFLPHKNEVLQAFGGREELYYRPLAHIVPLLSYVLFQQQTVGYHLMNLLLLCGAAWLLYRLIVRISGDRLLALVSGGLVLVHPINGIVVNFITASVFAVQIIFMLGGCHCYLQARQESSRRQWWLWTAGGLVCYAGAVLCHESAAALVLYVSALAWVLRRERPAGKVRDPLLLFWVMFALILVFRALQTSMFRNMAIKLEMHPVNVIEYASTMLRLAVWYVGRLFFPTGIVIIKTLPVAMYAWGWFLVLAAVLAGGAGMYRRMAGAPAARWGLLVFGLGFVPFVAASLYVSEGLMIEPHWFVFSVLGFFVAVAWFLTAAIRRGGPAGICLALLVVGLWGFLSRTYNGMWSRETLYCQYWISQVGEYRPLSFFLARAYVKENNFILARRYYLQALSADMVDANEIIYSNLAYIAWLNRDLKEAKGYYLRALGMNPRSTTALNGLGFVAAQNGDLETARDYFERSARVDALSILPRLNLARYYMRSGNRARARAYYEEIMRIDPHDTDARREYQRSLP